MNFLRGRTDKWYINIASPDRLCVGLPDLTLKLNKFLAANVEDQKSIPFRIGSCLIIMLWLFNICFLKSVFFHLDWNTDSFLVHSVHTVGLFVLWFLCFIRPGECPPQWDAVSRWLLFLGSKNWVRKKKNAHNFLLLVCSENQEDFWSLHWCTESRLLLKKLPFPMKAALN